MKVSTTQNKHSFEILPRQLPLQPINLVIQRDGKQPVRHHFAILKPIKQQAFRYDDINEFKVAKGKGDHKAVGHGRSTDRGTDPRSPSARAAGHGREAENLSNGNVTLYKEAGTASPGRAPTSTKGIRFAQHKEASMNSTVRQDDFMMATDGSVPGPSGNLQGKVVDARHSDGTSTLVPWQQASSGI